MARVARILGVLAALLFVTALLLTSLPNRAEVMGGFTPPKSATYGRVDCGTPFKSTRWSGADECEGPVLGRGGVVLLAGSGAVLLAVAGAGLWVASSRPWRARR